LILNDVILIAIQIAGGTGITPMLQIVEAVLKNPDDYTQVSLQFHPLGLVISLVGVSYSLRD